MRIRAAIAAFTIAHSAYPYLTLPVRGVRFGVLPIFALPLRLPTGSIAKPPNYNLLKRPNICHFTQQCLMGC